MGRQPDPACTRAETQSRQNKTVLKYLSVVCGVLRSLVLSIVLNVLSYPVTIICFHIICAVKRHVGSTFCFAPPRPQVCEKDGYHMTWAVKMVQQICKVFSTAPERFCFIQQLESMFSEVTREVFELSVTGEVEQLPAMQINILKLFVC